MKETLSETINILGYSGQYLSQQFETLYQMGFKGNVMIIRNEKMRRSEAPFKTNFNYNEIMFDNCTNIPSKNLLLCTNKPASKNLFIIFITNYGTFIF